MKNSCLLLCMLSSIFGICSQSNKVYVFNDLFTNTCGFYGNDASQTIFPNTNSLTMGKWQIGGSYKSTINTVFDGLSMLITDTINPYPINTTSTYLIKSTQTAGFEYQNTALISGQYWVNSDTLNDFGLFEFSLNDGLNWENILSSTDWQSPKPVFTGNSNGWNYFSVNLASFGAVYPVVSTDTILFRISFISDGISESLDGLAFDNITFCNYVEGLDENQNIKIIVSPNPSNGYFNVNWNEGRVFNGFYTVTNLMGQIIEKGICTSDTNEINIINCSDGVYFLNCYDDRSIKISTQLLVKN